MKKMENDTKTGARNTFRTESELADIPFARNATREYWHDSDCPELKVYANKLSKVFYVEKTKNGQLTPVKLGSVESMCLDEARMKAKEIAKHIENGTWRRNLAMEATKAVTLVDAFGYLCEADLRKSSKDYYGSVWKRHLCPKFGKRNMVEFSEAEDEVAAWHRELMRKKSVSIADACMKTIDTLYIHARKRHSRMPPAPSRNVERQEYEPKKLIPPDKRTLEAELRAHHAAVALATDMPVHHSRYAPYASCNRRQNALIAMRVPRDDGCQQVPRYPYS